MPTKARYLADLLNASGELDSTGAVESIQDNISTLFSAGTHTGISFTYDDSNATFSAAVNQDAVAAGFYHKIAVTVSSMKYYLDGTQQATAILSPSVLYRFDLSDSSNATHPLRFSTTSDGTHNSGAEISAGYTTYSKQGTPGSSGAYTEVCFEQDQTNPLYYYCSAHSGMGGTALLGVMPNSDFLTEGSTNLYYTDEKVQDVVGAQIATNGSHTGLSATYDDAGDGAIDITLSDEYVQDLVGAMVSSNTESGISVTYEDADGTLDFNVNDPTITLAGDVTGSATMTDLGNVSITTTIAADSIALGTDTTGNYVQSITGTANEVEISGSGSESADVTIGLPNDVTIGNDLTVTGDLTVSGTTTTVSSSTVAIADVNMKVAKDNSANAVDFGIYGAYNDGSAKFAGLNWDASESDKFRLFHGTATEPNTVVNTGASGWTKGTLIADLEGNASTATALETSRTLALAGDVTGSASFDGSGNATITATISADSVALGTDTTGNYVADVAGGTGITVTHSAGEASTPSVAADLATTSAVGVASFNSTDFTVTSGNVELVDEAIQDVAGAQLATNGSHTGITATYDDAGDGAIDLALITENVEDITGAQLATNGSHTGITATYDDAGDGAIDLALVTENVQDIAGAQLATNGSHTGISFTYDDSGDGAIDAVVSGAAATIISDFGEAVADTVGAMFSGNTETNITATYVDDDNTIDLAVSGNMSSIVSDYQEAIEDVVGAMVGSNTESGIAVTYDDTNGKLDFDVSDPTITLAGDLGGSATITNLGNATLTATIQAGSVENSMLAGSIANSNLANSTITVSDGSNTTATALGGTITFAGTSNEVDVAESSGTITYGLPADVTISNDLTVSGDLTVTGSTTQTGAVVTDNNFTGLTNANSGNSTDFGFYGKYVESSTTKYAGLFYDASTDNTFRLFRDTETVPSTTVNTSASGYGVATLVANITGDVSGSSGSTTGNAATATALATARNISGVSFDGTANITLDTDDIGEGSSNLYHTSERVQDVAGAQLATNGSHTGVSVAYDDAGDGAIDITVANSDFALTGDVTGTVTQTAKGNVSIATTIAADSVALGTDTTGNYVAGVSGGTGVSVSGSGSENATATVSIGQAVATTSDVTFADIAATGDVTITGDLTINGTTTTASSTNTVIADRLIELGNGTTGTPANDMGIVLERGSSDNVFIGWDESADVVTVGTGSFTGASTGDLTITAAALTAGEFTGTGGTFGNVQVGVTGDGEIDTSSGNLTIDSAGGTTTIDDTVSISGAATTDYTTIGSSAKSFRNVFIHDSAPSGSDGAVGDIWVTY
tara:strand:+ start:7475 stop:11425 length:3951 start_codon:yes stop_codon:yes gene_type:complete